MRQRRGERILGPYEQPNGWRVVEVDARGERKYTLFPTEEKALRYVEILTAELDREEHTTATALDEYTKYLAVKGNRQASIDVTEWAIEQFFTNPIALHMLSSKRCAALYDDLRTRPSARTGKPLAADTHRNVLAQVKSFLEWCIGRGWIRGENPAADVKGIGKRRPRGKSLGKSGAELRVRDARAWYVKALDLVDGGDEGAIAALVALLLGMRASEIVSRRVSDLDSDSASGDLLLACAERKALACYLFETTSYGAHWRDWIIGNVHRICGLAKVPTVTAHAMRGLLATLTAERGLAGHLIAATLGHEDERTTMHAYAAPGSAAAGARRRGWEVLNGGVQSEPKSAK